MDVDKFEGGTGRSEDLWMENENIFDRSERSPSVGPSVVLFTDGGREPFFKAADDAIAKRCDALSSHLPLPPPPPSPTRLGEIINSEAKNRRKIGFGGGRGTREGGRCDGGLFVCLTVSRGECTRRCRILESVWLRCRSDGGGKPRGDATKAQRFLRASWPRNLHH